MKDKLDQFCNLLGHSHMLLKNNKSCRKLWPEREFSYETNDYSIKEDGIPYNYFNHRYMLSYEYQPALFFKNTNTGKGIEGFRRIYKQFCELNADNLLIGDYAEALEFVDFFAFLDIENGLNFFNDAFNDKNGIGNANKKFNLFLKEYNRAWYLFWKTLSVREQEKIMNLYLENKKI